MNYLAYRLNINMASKDVLSNLSIGPMIVTDPGPPELIYSPPAVTPTQAINRSISKTTSISSSQYPLERPKYYTTISVSEYSRFTGGGNFWQVARTEPFSNYVLPLPENMVDVHPVGYDQTALGVFSGNILNAASKVGEAVQTNNPAKLAAAAPSTAAAVGVAAGAAAIQRVAPTAASALSGIVNNTLGYAGYAPNQFLTILLRGPEYKRHTLKWKVSPRNARESLALRQILVDFNNYMAPGVTFGGALFTFPKIFTIGYQPAAGYLYKFKPAVLETLAVDYSAGGAPSFFQNTNAPTVIEFQMHFLELEFWLTGDYNTSDITADVGDHSSIGQTSLGDIITQGVTGSGPNGAPQQNPGDSFVGG